MNLFLNLLFRKVFEEKLFLHLTKAAFGAILSLLYGEVLKWSKRRDSKSCCFLQKLNIFYTERYRSGHNGADSKSVCEQSHAGSNPALSAKNP